MSSPTNTAGYFNRYIQLVTEQDASIAFTKQWETLKPFFGTIDEAKSTYAYAPGKWTIKELLQHLIDSERIFSYRALSIARGEQANLPGFDEEAYALKSEANARSWQDLVDEFFTVRITTMQLFHSFSKQTLEAKGKANNNQITVSAIAYIIIGHCTHHEHILKEKYL